MSTAASFIPAGQDDNEFHWQCMSIGGVRQNVRILSRLDEATGLYVQEYVNAAGTVFTPTPAEITAATDGTCPVGSRMVLRRFGGPTLAGGAARAPDGPLFDMQASYPAPEQVQSVTVQCRVGSDNSTNANRVDMQVGGLTRVIAAGETFTWTADGPDSSYLDPQTVNFTATALGNAQFTVLVTLRSPV